MDVIEELASLRVVPVVTIEDPGQAVAVAEALAAGGLPAAEVTFRTDAAAEAIARIAEALPDFLVGAGTVLNPDMARRAVEAGARFVVAPGYDPGTVAWCQYHEVPVIPGVDTPSEVMAAKAQGLTVLKLFPASVLGGPTFLKALSGPFSDVRFMCTGGVRPSNEAEYLSQPNVLCVGGTWLTPADALAEGDWARVSQLCREAKAAGL